jgi:hypothetical protein
VDAFYFAILVWMPSKNDYDAAGISFPHGANDFETIVFPLDVQVAKQQIKLVISDS